MGNVYTRKKIFHFKDKLDSLSQSVDEIMPPIHIRIKPTNVCNHNCWYCAYKADKMQLGQDMLKRDFIPKEKLLEIIDDLIEMGVKAVTFSGGGEPFCYPYLLDAVKKLSQSQIKFAALTNGSRMSGEVAEIFANYGTWVRVSMDGWDGESYAQYRGVSNREFEKVMTNIKNFKNINGTCQLGVSLIVDNKNFMHVYELIKKLVEAGINSVKISPCIIGNDVAENNCYHQPLFAPVKEQVKRILQDFAGPNFEVFDDYHELNDLFCKDYTWCPFLQVLPVIGADCNIYPCQDKAYNLEAGLIGSVKNQRFKDFWFSDKSKFFKINPAQVCNHHCVANEKNKMILEYLNVDPEHLAFV
ncbi:MAG: radical SAM protein [Candidatus Margulisiibacteriota bacterium]